MSHDPGKTPLSPVALSIRDTARLLTRVGGERITEEMIQADLGAGAPANPDGTLNLIHYAAWLVREMAIDNGSPHGD